MTLSLELTPDEEHRINLARTLGIDITAMVRGVIAGLPSSHETERKSDQDETLALLARWHDEDATTDDEELERRDNELHDFTENMNANRAANGEEPLY